MDIRSFAAADQAAVTRLILAIQRDEFGMSITADDQPDLAAIPTFYQKDEGNFWVARHLGQIIGTIGLLDIGGGDGALRKMFVDKAHRGPELGIASALLQALVDWARQRRFARIYLGTTAHFHAAHRFYERSGFEEIGRDDLPAAFPVMAVDTRFFLLRL